MMWLGKAWWNSWYLGRVLLRSSVLVVGFFMRLWARNRRIGEDVDLTVAGFPRVGNTYTGRLIQASAEHPVRMAHHFHAAAQVVTSANRGVPTVVLLRNPEDTVLSLCVAHPELWPWVGHLAYAVYHARLWPHRRRIVFVRFESTTADPARVIRELKERCGLPLRVDAGPDTEARILETIHEDYGTAPGQKRKVAAPSAEKERLKAALRSAVEGSAARGPGRRLYNLLVENAI